MFPASIFSLLLVTWTLQLPDGMPNTYLWALSLNNQLKSCKHPSKLLHQLRSMSEVTLFSIDNGKTITLKRGQMLVIRLDENPTTGYRWSTPNLSTQILQLKNDQFNQFSHGAIGSGGQRVFIFQANHPGQTKLQLKNWREWSGEESTNERFEATIQVVE